MQKEFCVKEIEKSQLESTKERQQVEGELARLKRLDHKNILRVFEKFETPDKIYFVLELCRGRSLREEVMEQGPFKEHQAAVIIFQILDALQYMHGQQIAHRDLKPDNILFADKNKKIVKLIDFGYSKDMSVESNEQTMVGTPDYVAPEVMQGTIEDIYKLDVWSAGCVLYFILFGESPFERWLDDARGLCTAIIEGNYSTESNKISEEAGSLIHKMMSVKINERWNAAQAMKDPWIVKNTNNSLNDDAVVAYVNPATFDT